MIILFLLILGAAVGSFIGALTWRWPRRIAISNGRSRCTHCKHTIRPKDNLPLLSYLILRGRCRDCNKPIPKRYFFIELGTAILFPVFYLLLPRIDMNVAWTARLGPGVLALFIFFVLAVLIAIFVIDLEHRYIPDSLVFSLLLLTVGLMLATSVEAIFQYLAAGAAAGVFLLALHLVTLGRGMGLGDVKLALALGTILGFPLVVVWMLGSLILGSVVGLVLIALGRAKFKQEIAFGPFLVVGFFLSLVLGVFYGSLWF